MAANIRPTEQDEEKRRSTREGYRQFQEQLLDEAQEVIKPDAEQDLLSEKLETVHKLFSSVDNPTPREAALDSASLVNISELGKKKAQRLKTDFQRFNPADFCEKVRIKLSQSINNAEAYGLSHENWVNLGKEVKPFFCRAPVINFMFGSFERGQVLKKKRAVKEKDIIDTESSSKATKPTQLSSFEETDRGELTTAQVEHLLKNLWRVYERAEKSPVCFFEFVTHPESYGQTVENIFYVSFLVRDGHVKVYLDEDQLPVIEPIQKDLETQGQAKEAQKHQVVITITPAEWKEIVRTFGIERPVIEPLKKQLKESNKSEDPEDPPFKGKGKGKGKHSDR